MRMYNLRQVKKEIRVLAIASKPFRDGNRFHVVGIVFRGRLCLDGVMRTTADGPDVTGDAIRMMKGSPHHPQIRVILLDADLIGEGASIDPYTLSIGASRPVIAINYGDSHCPVGNESGKRLTLKWGETPIPALSLGLRSRVALKVLETVSHGNTMPEALRVAKLVVSALPEDFLT
jgi:endonuclease V-like protein UPF0215 family